MSENISVKKDNVAHTKLTVLTNMNIAINITTLIIGLIKFSKLFDFEEEAQVIVISEISKMRAYIYIYLFFFSLSFNSL